MPHISIDAELLFSLNAERVTGNFMFSEIIFLTLRIMFVRYDFILLNLYIISTRNDIDWSWRDYSVPSQLRNCRKLEMFRNLVFTKISISPWGAMNSEMLC